MKIKLPERKKNKNETAQTDGAVFDLTGGAQAEAKAPVLTTGYEGASDANGKKRGVKGVAGKIGGAFKRDRNRKPAAAKTSDTGSSAGSFGIINDDKDAFTVSVRNSEPILKRLDTAKAGRIWLRDLQINLATAAVIFIMFCLLLSAAYLPELIPFAIPAIVVFMAMTTLETLEKDKIRLYTAAALGVLLIVALIVLRKYIGSGWGLIMNSLYETGEESQAYIYDRLPVGSMGDEHPNRSMHFALLWGSSLVALIASLPKLRARRTVGIVAAGFLMIAFAYYGIIPSGYVIAALVAALVFVMARGHILSSLPVFLIVMIIFGAIMFVDPGENYGISRADENFRDRFALRSAYLDNGDSTLEDLSGLEDNLQNDQDQQNEGDEGFVSEHKGMISLVILLLILAAIGAAAWMFRKRIQKRQQANRAGIDSQDAREAIVAMFPYAVRWLQPAGIDPSGKSFDSLIPVIRADISTKYADRYAGMYELWKEAAYSNHTMDDGKKLEMDTFLQDTITMIKEKGDFRTNFINAMKYAL